MSREYVCGVIRDQLKRFMVIEYHLANSRKVASITSESWVSSTETPRKALEIEFRNYLGIKSLDELTMVASKTLTKVGKHSTQNIQIFLMDIRKTTSFRLLDGVAGAYFMPWDQLVNAVKTGRMSPTSYSQCVADRLYMFKELG